MTNRQALAADRIQADLETITLGHTTHRYGRTITRHANGFEIGTIDGRTPLVSGEALAEEIARQI